MFTNNWHEGQSPMWEKLIIPLRPSRYLEIGSYEGQSAKWILDKTEADVVCVDTWDGEGQGSGCVAEEYIDKVETRFDANMKEYGGRVTKLKGKSFDCLKNLEGQFDLVYIDGSHLARHVIEDAVLSFALLRKGGVLVFDDYGWKGFKEEWKNPKLAIDAFFNIFREEIQVIHVGWQAFVIKL